MRLFLDTNVVLDVLVERHPWFTDSAALLSLVESGEAEALVAAHAISTLHYLLSKQLGRRRAAAALVELVRVVRVAAVDHDLVLRALSLGGATWKMRSRRSAPWKPVRTSS